MNDKLRGPNPLASPFNGSINWSSLIAGAKRERDASKKALRKAIKDPTFEVQQALTFAALEAGRSDIVDNLERVNSFVAEIVRIKRLQPGITDSDIHQAIAQEAELRPDDAEARDRLATSTMLQEETQAGEPVGYIFKVPTD